MIVGIMASLNSQNDPLYKNQKTMAMSVVYDDGNLNEQEWYEQGWSSGPIKVLNNANVTCWLLL